MSARNAAARLDVTAPISAPGTPAPITDLAAQRIRARRRRELNIYGLRVLVAVIVLGSWELTTRIGIVDQFFFGQHSGIAKQLWIWITEKTAMGPLRAQVLLTIEVTVLGSTVGTVLVAATHVLL